jgi:tetratricopeptide (TPR) repeat protein
MVGLAPKPGAGLPPVPKPGGPPPVAPTTDFGSLDLDAALPAVKAVSPNAPTRQIPAVAQPAAAPARPPAFPGLDDLDLPALAGEVGLPAAAPPRGGAKPAAGGPPAFDFEVDLPAVAPPAPAKGGFGEIDLPAPRSGHGSDLPMAKSGFADLPMAQRGGAPAPPPFKAKPASPGGGFGELDLPAIQNDLPQRGGPADLPSPLAAGAHLPTPVAAGAHLPSPAGAQAHLPTPMGAGAHLPTAMSPAAHLPVASGVGLPSPMGAGAHLPTAMGANAHMPVPVADERLLPSKQGGDMAFGELDLPLVGGGDAATVSPDSFGEVDLPPDPQISAPPPQAGAGAGGMAFGEVDLGSGSSGSSPPVGPPVATSAGTLAFQEASLESAGGPAATAMPRPQRGLDRPARSSKLPKIIGIGLAVVVLGGAALQLTPYGAFGHLWISDKLHANENLADAAAKGDLARKKLAVDTFASAQSAADDLFEARKRAARSRPLGAYAAFVEYMNQVRFGLDPARAARVSPLLAEIPPNVEVRYLAAAQAAQVAQTADWAAARQAVDSAMAKEPKDGVQQDLSCLKGEIALAQKDSPTALAAFTSVNAAGPSARASFGIARAHMLTKSLDKARDAVDATLKASPNHAGALTLRAQLLWEMQRDDVAAGKVLATILDDKNKKTLGPAELAATLTAKGWLMLARDRAGEARASFDEAVKTDPRNTSALVGQGEVLYADGRNAEALTRFDDAVQRDPANIGAILGSAKAKIALERLSDAKAQLSAARQKAPRDMNLALWLAKVEEALGNKKPAEDLYAIACDLADPQNADAIQSYAAFARFLASQGRKSEADAKLEQARAKLPDSASLQRAFGEVAVAQGEFPSALEHFEAALQKNPADLGTRFRLGVAYRKMHKLDLAARALDEVSAIDKEYPGIALERGLLFEESGDIQGALTQFSGALQKYPNDPDLMLRVGAAYVAVGDTEKAIPLLTKVKDIRPNSAEANHFVGRAFLKQGGLEAAAAMPYLQRAVALDPNRAEYHLYVAWAANEATPAQLGLARTEVEKALALDKLNGDAYWQRGVLLRKEGQVVDAIKDLKRALELKPTRFEAHATLAEAFEDKNDMAGAMAEWQKAIAGDDKPAYWRWKYGKLLAVKGQNAEAAKHLGYAVEQGKAAQPRPGWLAPAAFEAGEALRKSGQKKDACERYALYMELSPSTAPDRRDATRAMNDLACPTER